MLANSHQTAIHRGGASAPCRWLDKQDRLVGPVLDWGCGRGADVRYIRNAYGYDPHYQPDPPTGETFNTVLCTYVLNVIPDYFSRADIIAEAVKYLERGGWLYVTIRARRSELTGWRKNGTWQGYVGDQLRIGGFTLIRGVADYEIWGWQKP